MLELCVETGSGKYLEQFEWAWNIKVDTCTRSSTDNKSLRILPQNSSEHRAWNIAWNIKIMSKEFSW